MAASNARPTKLPPLPLKNQPLVRQAPSVFPRAIPPKTREGLISPSGTIKQQFSQDISPTSIRTNEEQESLIVLLLSEFMAYVASKAYVQALENVPDHGLYHKVAVVDPTNALIKEYQPVLRERIAQLEAASSEEAENSPEESDSEEEDSSDADTSGTEEGDSKDEETCESIDSSSENEQ
ncbi:hypothetical protein SpCBS45565_g07956 [Spizellomyces sp. 'palustris']|nr:hypothetical protein SpCBS45565_g07956 [Spizellomyces sp. 'palustris']